MYDKHRGLYWLVLMLAIALTALYADRRNLYGRYLEHQQGSAAVREKAVECEQVNGEIEASRLHIEHLGSDPVEIEAAIRGGKDLVREGEKVFRIERAPKKKME